MGMYSISTKCCGEDGLFMNSFTVCTQAMKEKEHLVREPTKVPVMVFS